MSEVMQARLSQDVPNGAYQAHNAFWATQVPSHKHAEVCIEVTDATWAAVFGVVVKAARTVPNAAIIHVDMRSVDNLAEVLATDSFLTRVYELVGEHFVDLLVLVVNTAPLKLNALLNEMADKTTSKMSAASVSVHALDKHPNDWDIDLGANLQYDCHADESMSTFPFEWGQVKWEWWKGAQVLPLCTYLELAEPVKDVSTPTIHRTTSGFWYRGAGEGYPYVVSDPPAMEATHLPAAPTPEHLVTLQEDRLQYAAMGYTVYRQCIDVT